MRMILSLMMAGMMSTAEPIYNEDGWGIALPSGCDLYSSGCRFALDTKYGWCDLIWDANDTVSPFKSTDKEGSCRIGTVFVQGHGMVPAFSHPSDDKDMISSIALMPLMVTALEGNRYLSGGVSKDYKK